KISLLEPIVIIGLVTFALSFLGVYVGKRLGHLFESKIEIMGGRDTHWYWPEDTAGTFIFLKKIYFILKENLYSYPREIHIIGGNMDQKVIKKMGRGGPDTPGDNRPLLIEVLFT
ncbi:MAG: hypothetical protein BME94_08205, partial [Methanobacteriales archaeon Met13]